jgi:ribonuclease P protein component
MDPAPPPDGAPGGEGLPRTDRIRRGGDIVRLLRTGQRHRTSHLEVFTAPAPEGRPRYGLIVPRHGRKIVARNLLKRRLREIGRRQVLPALRGASADLDVLVRARPGAYGADFTDLCDQLDGLTKRLCSDPSS